MRTSKDVPIKGIRRVVIFIGLARLRSYVVQLKHETTNYYWLSIIQNSNVKPDCFVNKRFIYSQLSDTADLQNCKILEYVLPFEWLRIILRFRLFWPTKYWNTLIYSCVHDKKPKIVYLDVEKNDLRDFPASITSKYSEEDIVFRVPIQFYLGIILLKLFANFAIAIRPYIWRLVTIFTLIFCLILSYFTSRELLLYFGSILAVPSIWIVSRDAVFSRYLNLRKRGLYWRMPTDKLREDMEVEISLYPFLFRKVIKSKRFKELSRSSEELDTALFLEYCQRFLSC